MKKTVGKVTTEEKDMILSLFERRNSLTELAKIITADDAIYEKMISDITSTNAKFQQWWNDMAEKYRWEGSENGHWEINFETNEIYLCYQD
ncbi:MAG: CXXX repeat peptide modification system protein [Candidatus Azobacteroides sp.]|nr:CXXX repeat peptide modification system protein [Candidatus Azobacteroides sp.]